MSEDKLRIVRALLAKTVANGCTVGEAASARAKAEELATKYGLDLAAAAPQTAKRTHATNDWARKAREQADFLRRAAEAARRAEERRQAALAQWAAEMRQQYRTIGDFATSRLMRENPRGEGFSYEKVLELVKTVFPDSKTTVNSLRWYEAQQRRRGYKVPMRPHRG